jgi:hypothetical protein
MERCIYCRSNLNNNEPPDDMTRTKEHIVPLALGAAMNSSPPPKRFHATKSQSGHTPAPRRDRNPAVQQSAGASVCAIVWGGSTGGVGSIPPRFDAYARHWSGASAYLNEGSAVFIGQTYN